MRHCASASPAIGWVKMSFGLTVIAVVLALALIRLALFRGPFANASEPPKGIIDMHCHTAGIGEGGSGAWISEELRQSWKFPLYLKIFGSSHALLKAKGDKAILEIIAQSINESEHVDGVVILAMDEPYSVDGEINLAEGEVCVPNRFVGESVKPYENLYFGASVHPDRKDALDELEWSKENGAVLLKWLPNIQDIDPSNPSYRDYYQKLVDLDLPLLTHVGDEDSFSKTNNALADPQLLRFPLECGVRVIAAHVASSGERDGQENIDRLLEMMPEYPNLYTDISTLTQFNRKRYLGKVLNDPRLKGRMMYGTDYPLTNTPMASPLQFPLNLKVSQLWSLWRTRNSWDRDVRLKAALGTPKEVFTLSREFLKM